MKYQLESDKNLESGVTIGSSLYDLQIIEAI